MTDQLSIFDALASLDPQLVVEMEAEPGWVWARCPACHEVRYLRRRDRESRCILTPGCPGRVEPELILECEACGKPVTARRIGHDLRFCSKKCEGTA